MFDRVFDRVELRAAEGKTATLVRGALHAPLGVLARAAVRAASS
jgi:hypothetical protein